MLRTWHLHEAGFCLCVRGAIPIEINCLAVEHCKRFFNYIRFKNNSVKIVFFKETLQDYKIITIIIDTVFCSKNFSVGVFVILSSL